MTDQDVERMLVQFRGRNRRRRTPRFIAVAAAAVLVLVAVLGAVAWMRRNPAPVPTTPIPASGDVGVWKGTDAAFPYIMVLRADGTVQTFSLSNGLLSRTSVGGSSFVPDDTSAGRHRVIGDTMELTNVLSPDRACSYGFVGKWVADGQAQLTQTSQTGSGCGLVPPPPPFTMVRVSPASTAGRAYSATATGDVSVVGGTRDLEGAWLLRGTGVVLSIGWTLPDYTRVPYVIDHKGTIDTTADDSGIITVPTNGRIVLTSANPVACPPAIMQTASASDFVMTARVEADPCHLFAGQTSLTWTRLQ
jgi:hypothetical protein